MKKLIKNGMLCTESGVYEADLLIEDGVIREIGTGLFDRLAPQKNKDGSSEDAKLQVIDAQGKYVLPGAVDIHTHMDLDVGIARVIDDFYTGTIAAACGGTTSIVDHMAFGPKDCSLWHQVEEYHKLADGNAVIDYGFHGVFQHVNLQVLKEMGEIAKKEGITSFKVYMTYNYGLTDGELMKILTRAKKEGILIASHCESDGIVNYWRDQFVKEGHTQAKYHPLSRPAEAEAEAVNRFLYLAKAAGEAPVYVVHLSSKEGLEEVRFAKRRGQKHFGVETCPQYLFLTDEKYADDREGLKAIMAPPLRKKEDNEALWQALEDGELDAVATDHCPFTFAKQKQQGAEDFTKCPSGAPGVEERLGLMVSEALQGAHLTIAQVVHYLCTNPAKIAGLYPKKGTIQVGSDADLVMIDPKKEWTITTKRLHGNADYTCYEGRKVTGAIEKVFLRGNEIVSDGNFVGKRGDGQYLKRKKSSLTE